MDLNKNNLTLISKKTLSRPASQVLSVNFNIIHYCSVINEILRIANRYKLPPVNCVLMLQVGLFILGIDRLIFAGEAEIFF